jgi:hypothetical protein
MKKLHKKVTDIFLNFHQPKNSLFRESPRSCFPYAFWDLELWSDEDIAPYCIKIEELSDAQRDFLDKLLDDYLQYLLRLYFWDRLKPPRGVNYKGRYYDGFFVDSFAIFLIESIQERTYNKEIARYKNKAYNLNELGQMMYRLTFMSVAYNSYLTFIKKKIPYTGGFIPRLQESISNNTVLYI